MPLLTESITLPVSVEIAQGELRRYFFRRAIGHYRTPDEALAWNPADDALTEGLLHFDRLKNGWSRLVVELTYDGEEVRRLGSSEAALRALVQGHLQRVWPPLADAGLAQRRFADAA
jgi:hypothetical protein